MKIKRSKTFNAEAVFGLKSGYKEDLISMDEIKVKMGKVQRIVHSELDLKLSAKISPCQIVFFVRMSLP